MIGWFNVISDVPLSLKWCKRICWTNSLAATLRQTLQLNVAVPFIQLLGQPVSIASHMILSVWQDSYRIVNVTLRGFEPKGFPFSLHRLFRESSVPTVPLVPLPIELVG